MVSTIVSYPAVASCAARMAARSSGGRHAVWPIACTRTRRRWICGSTASWCSLASTAARMPGHLGRRAVQIVRRANPQGNGGDRRLAAPVQHGIQLPGAQLIDARRVGHAPELPPAPVAVENQTDMAWRLVRKHLPQQPALIERVKRPGHRRPHAGPGAAQPQPPIDDRPRGQAQDGRRLNLLRHELSAPPRGWRPRNPSPLRSRAGSSRVGLSDTENRGAGRRCRVLRLRPPRPASHPR